jgi:hypothetical protein
MIMQPDFVIGFPPANRINPRPGKSGLSHLTLCQLWNNSRVTPATVSRDAKMKPQKPAQLEASARGHKSVGFSIKRGNFR